LVIDDIAAGRLVWPLAEVIETPFNYWELCLPERRDDPRVRRFRAWLVDQFTRDGLHALR
jgi:LysR family transcriptional regulator, glycine cleavage system transcriptional activator